MEKRLSWDEYFMNIAIQVSLRSTCLRRKVGSVIVKNNMILSTGYNGAPSGLPNCIEYCDRCYRSKHNIPSGSQLNLCYAVHAEQNAIMNALKTGESLADAKIYVNVFPCSTCAKLIIQSGIREIYYIEAYEDEFTKLMLKEANVKLTKIDSDIFRTPIGYKITTNNDLDSIDPIVKEIYFAGFEPGTTEFIENREKVFDKYNLFEKYGDELIYVFDYKMDKEMVTGDDIFTLLIDMKKHMSVDWRVNREYNGDDCKQAVVGTVLYNPYLDEFGVLEAISGRLDGKLTMIQGHVAIDKNQVEYALKDFNFNLNENLFKEMGEEVGFSVISRALGYDTKFEAIIQSNDNKISSEHVGFLFITRVFNNNVWEALTSKEPEKHRFIRIKSDHIMKDEIQNKMDTWLKKFINHIIYEKPHLDE